MAIILVSDTNLTNIANAIREKNGETTSYKVNEMAEAINGMEPDLQSKTVSPSTSSQTVAPDSGYDGLSQVTVNAVTSSIDSDIKASNIKSGVNILGVTGTLVEGITPSGTKEITENGTFDVTNYASANVNIASGGVETCEGRILGGSPISLIEVTYFNEDSVLTTTNADGDFGLWTNFIKNSIIVTSGRAYSDFSPENGISKIYNNSTLCVWHVTGDFMLGFD